METFKMHHPEYKLSTTHPLLVYRTVFTKPTTNPSNATFTFRHNAKSGFPLTYTGGAVAARTTKTRSQSGESTK